MPAPLENSELECRVSREDSQCWVRSVINQQAPFYSIQQFEGCWGRLELLEMPYVLSMSRSFLLADTSATRFSGEILNYRLGCLKLLDFAEALVLSPKNDPWSTHFSWLRCGDGLVSPGDWSQWPGRADHSVGDERQSDQWEYHVPQSQTYHQMIPGHHMSIIISGHQHLRDLSQGSCQGCGHSQGNTKIILILIVFIVEQSTWLNNENFT